MNTSREFGFCFKKEVCRTCGSGDLKKVVELTPTPPGNNFIKKEDIGTQEKEYPLQLDFCNNCFHIQLGHVVDPRFLFQNDYSYVSSTSKVFVNHLEEYSSYIIKLLNIETDSLIVDIGSNDGTCLSFFKKNGMRVIGVDPAEGISKIANDNGIPTINDFFDPDVSKSIRHNHGPAKLITSHNACAHIDDLGSVIQSVESLLDDDGFFVMEVGYFVDVFQNNWFDTVYHEHVDFHTVHPLTKLFERFDMNLFRVERVSPQGGSIRVMAQKKSGRRMIDDTVENLINLESDLGLDRAETLVQYEREINKIRKKFMGLISEIKSDGKTIAAFGAATKATTLSYHFGLDKEDILFIVDDNPLKQGFVSPGKHIPVCSSENIYNQMPDYIVILAWNFAESIMKQHEKYVDLGGSFIVPMPEPRIVS